MPGTSGQNGKGVSFCAIGNVLWQVIVYHYSYWIAVSGNLIVQELGLHHLAAQQREKPQTRLASSFFFLFRQIFLQYIVPENGFFFFGLKAKQYSAVQWLRRVQQGSSQTVPCTR